MSDLKRIEETHRRIKRQSMVANAPALLALSGDVVKLARALDEILQLPYPTMEVREMTQTLGEVTKTAKRVLREVAGSE